MIVTVLCMSLGAGPAVIEPIPPFEGDRSEDIEKLFPGAIGTFEVFLDPPSLDGDGEANGTVGVVAVTSNSSFMGSTVVPHSGLLYGHATNPIEVAFFSPVQDFGAFLATNGGASGGTVEFYDPQGQLAGTQPLDVTFQPGIAPYTWNGWTSSVPISRIIIKSNGAIQGFLGIDDMEMSFAPLPPCSADLDGDGTIGVDDLVAVILSWGPCEACAGCPGDANLDCIVDVGDLVTVVETWGPCRDESFD